MTVAQRSWINSQSSRIIRRPIRHLTPRYVFDRSRVWLHRRRHPDAPWLTSEAIAILSKILRSQDRGFEYGSGRSTTWLAKRTAHLVSVESSQIWHDRLTAELDRMRIGNVSYQYIPSVDLSNSDQHAEQYVESCATHQLSPFDYVLVDGLYRDLCALKAVHSLNVGGVLILDNAERYIPHSTRSPFRVREFPNSLWTEFSHIVSDWRLIWTSNGVWDTAIWFKNC